MKEMFISMYTVRRHRRFVMDTDYGSDVRSERGAYDIDILEHLIIVIRYAMLAVQGIFKDAYCSHDR